MHCGLATSSVNITFVCLCSVWHVFSDGFLVIIVGRLENQESRIGTGTGKPEQEQEQEPEPEPE